jgi:hypothetical protein
MNEQIHNLSAAIKNRQKNDKVYPAGVIPNGKPPVLLEDS